MRCIYKVLFTRVHPRAEKVNAWASVHPAVHHLVTIDKDTTKGFLFYFKQCSFIGIGVVALSTSCKRVCHKSG